MTIGPLYQSVGGLEFPLPEDAVTTTGAALDPVRDRLLALFESAINAELGPAWDKATAALGGKSKLVGTKVVQDTLPLQPSATAIGQRKNGFPLLCIHRTGDTEIEEYLMDSFRERQTWSLHWILGPGDIEVERRLGDFAQAIRKLLALVIRQRGHSSFEDGALQFFPSLTDEDGNRSPGTGSLGSAKLIRSSALGQASFASDDTTTYWACVYTIETTETARDNIDALGDFDAVDLDVSLDGPDDLLPSFAQGASDMPIQNG